jgi:hypothetical protein
MGVKDFISARPESSLMSTFQFMVKVNYFSEVFQKYIELTDTLHPSFANGDIKESSVSCICTSIDEVIDCDLNVSDVDLAHKAGGDALKLLEVLQQFHWIGGVSFTFRNWLRERYAKMYCNLTAVDREKAMARYLGCILVRKVLQGVGVYTNETPFGRLEIGLVPPLPYSPDISSRVYLRSFQAEIVILQVTRPGSIQPAQYERHLAT